MTFQPDPNWLNGVLQLFRDNLHATSNAQLQNILQQLDKLQTHPHFNNYLAYIVSTCTQEPETLRAQVGLKLKNSIRANWEDFPPPIRQYVMQQVIQTVGTDSQYVRNIVGTIITTIATKDLAQSEPPRTDGWAQIFGALASMLDNPNPHVVDGALNALSKICEDMGELLGEDALGPALGMPLNHLIPKFVNMLKHASEHVRKNCLGSLNVLSYANALNPVLDQYMQNLFDLATGDHNKEVKKKVCQAFVQLLEDRYNALAPHMESVIKFMLAGTQDSDEIVALEACEFWSNFCESQEAQEHHRETLRRHLGYLVPVLLKGMVYSDADIMLLDAENNDSSVPDRQQDIKPRIHHTKVMGSHPHEDDEEYEGDDDDEEATEWNLRKCSAASLDQLANLYGDELLVVLLPELQKTLNSEDWKVCEAAVLALGAVAEGCLEGIRPHLKQLVPFLITSKLNCDRPLVRSITCWTLSRYSKWIMVDRDDSHFFVPLMQNLLARIQDPNKKVQEAACSAFATLEEEAQDRLRQYLPAILPQLMAAFKVYQTKNLLILYDALSTLAEAVGRGLNDPGCITTLMPPLMEKFTLIQDGDRTIFPLLECLASIAQASGRGFIPYAEKVFARCLNMIQTTLVASKHAQLAQERGQDCEPPDKEFIVCALDLLSGLTEGLEATVETLVANSNILALLWDCIREPDDDVRQSAFALLGDFAKACIGHLRPHLAMYLPVAAANLDPRLVSVCNNASWAIGEIALRCGTDIAPFVPMILGSLIRIINQPKLIASLLENTAITLGRIGWVCPALLAPQLDSFAQQWCIFLARIREPTEKEHAFNGLLNVIRQDPKRILPHFPEFCRAIASCNKLDERMQEQFKAVLKYFKEQLAGSWPVYFGRCAPQLQNHLVNLYQL